MRREVMFFTDTTGFGGAERALLALIEGLDPDRWRSTLAHHDGAGARPLVDGARALGAETWCVPAMPHGRGTLLVPAFARALRRRRPVVFHAHLTWPLAAKNGLLGAIAARVPAVVATVHLHMDVPVSRGMALQQRLIAAGVDRIVAVSHDNAQRLASLMPWPRAKIAVIHNGVAGDRTTAADPALRSALAADRPLVLTVARLDRQKGHRYLLDAVPEVPDAVFALVGDGPERPALEQLAEQLGVCDRVRFLGARDDVRELLAACDVFVLPSLYEGLPLAILEAMAAGCAVLATDVGGTGEVVTDGATGLLVAPADPTALAAALRRLIADPQLRARLGAAAQGRVASAFSVHAMVRQVSELYESLVGGA